LKKRKSEFFKGLNNIMRWNNSNKEENASNKISRKKFLRDTVGLGLVTSLGLSSCQTEPNVPTAVNIHSGKRYRWKMVTTWPPNFPILGEACIRFAENLKKLTDGRLEVKVYGAGELIPAMECFDAVTAGAVQMASGASYYWAGKNAATQYFTTIPFGMNAQQLNAWFYFGGGIELWNKLYDRFGIIPFPAGNTGVQMAGWFNREINSMSDLKGLKMRIPGLGGKVLQKAGGTAVLSSGSEIYTNLERGVIDAAEWIGPYHDYIMGFHKIAKYYYAPGWHEPGSCLELFVNKPQFLSLPESLQHAIKMAAAEMNVKVLSEFEAKNSEFLRKILTESNTQLKSFNDEVLQGLKAFSKETMEELANKDKVNREIYDSILNFKEDIRPYADISEKLYFKHF
jgi:TRAP-type mannitol/chloroaromatic compound transport system substrate-binding protein